MSLAPIMLGGLPIVAHSGAPEETIEPIGGNAVLRMSDGSAVKQQHWSRMSGSISGQGFMPPGLDGLDYTQPLELRSTKVQNMVNASPTFVLIGTPRPDVEPWAQALVGEQWVPTPSTFEDGQLTAVAVPGASLYQASWLPVYSVFGNKPSGSQSTGTAMHSWTFNWEEA